MRNVERYAQDGMLDVKVISCLFLSIACKKVGSVEMSIITYGDKSSPDIATIQHKHHGFTRGCLSTL